MKTKQIPNQCKIYDPLTFVSLEALELVGDRVSLRQLLEEHERGQLEHRIEEDGAGGWSVCSQLTIKDKTITIASGWRERDHRVATLVKVSTDVHRGRVT
jgi:hypothetical protein